MYRLFFSFSVDGWYSRDSPTSRGTCCVDFLLLFVLRGIVPAEREHASAIVFFDNAVIGTLQVLLDSPGDIWYRNGWRRGAILKAHVSRRTDPAAAPFNFFKPDVRMFRNHRNFRTHSSLLVERRSRDSPISCMFFIIRVYVWFFLSFVEMYQLCWIILMPCSDLSTLSSAPSRCLWTSPVISESEMLNEEKPFTKLTSLDR